MNKTLLLSIVVIAAIITALALFLPRTSENIEPVRIYIDKELPAFGNTFAGYVKAQDVKPNSALYFVYPRTGDKQQDSELFKLFTLVRLPAWKGGDANDASAFRSYSVMDLTILGTTGCMVKYWPDDGRQRLEDPCSGSTYRIEDGLAIAGPAYMQNQPENVLPKLDIGIDEEGYLYVKPPKFDPNYNGVVRYGRYLSDEEIVRTSENILQHYEKLFKEKFNSDINIPLRLPTGEVLTNIVVDNSDNSASVSYSTLKIPKVQAGISISFCNCTQTIGEAALEARYEKYIKFWEVNDIPITVRGSALYEGEDAQNNRIKTYSFQFVKDRFRLGVEMAQPFDKIAQFVLDNFFNVSQLSDLKRVEVGQYARESLVDSAKNSSEYTFIASKYSEPYFIDVFEKTNVIVFASTIHVEGALKGRVEVNGFVDPTSGKMTDSYATCYLEPDDGYGGIIQDSSTDNVLEFLENPTCIEIFQKLLRR